MAAVSPVGRDAAADAVTGLYERHAGGVFQFCLRWLRSREEAEDAAQTTFLYAFRGLDRGVVPALERPWLLSIARNVCLSRSDAARRRAVEVAQDPHTLEETVAAPAQANELDGLTSALASLTEQQRQAILLREWHGLSYREIAEQLELSQAAVETLLFRARRSLARRLRPVGLGSFLPWLRSLAESGAAKVVTVGAVAIAAATTTGAIAIAHQPEHWQPARAPLARSVAASPATGSTRRLHAPKVVHTKRHDAVSPYTAPTSRPQAPVVTPSTVSPTTAGGAQATGTAPAATSAVQTVADGATGTANTVVDSASGAVDSAVAATGATTSAATSTVAQTGDTASTALSGITALLTPPPLP
jgi:RNA polymerase sigma-70 factor (ECF subfamily)